MPTNFQMVSYHRNGLSEKDIKKFFKKCKKQEITKEYLEKTSFHRTKSEKLRDKRKKNAFLRHKYKNKW
jgi:hypothetical protein